MIPFDRYESRLSLFFFNSLLVFLYCGLCSVFLHWDGVSDGSLLVYELNRIVLSNQLGLPPSVFIFFYSVDANIDFAALEEAVDEGASISLYCLLFPYQSRFEHPISATLIVGNVGVFLAIQTLRRF